MKWKYDRKAKQDNAEGKSMGCFRRTYSVGRYEGRFRVAICDWRIQPVKVINLQVMGDVHRLKDAKAIAEILEKSQWIPYVDDKVDKKSIKRHLEAALAEVK
jgi:hypothetical protein